MFYLYIYLFILWLHGHSNPSIKCQVDFGHPPSVTLPGLASKQPCGARSCSAPRKVSLESSRWALFRFHDDPCERHTFVYLYVCVLCSSAEDWVLFLLLWSSWYTQVTSTTTWLRNPLDSRLSLSAATYASIDELLTDTFGFRIVILSSHTGSKC